jgi:pantoate--beta-alanine ligase
MVLFNEILPLQSYLSEFKGSSKIGFVPTMGALHRGHLSLVERAKKENDLVVASIFVNPTQFDRAEDLLKYPKTLESDKQLLNSVGCDVIFAPTVQEMYPEKIASQKFNFAGLDAVMEGKFRLGHFDGVGTVVKRLFDIVKPENAYFGEKDYQQLMIVKKMVETEKITVNIIGCRISREPDGLAMSSRNKRLTEVQRLEAPLIYKSLQKAKAMFPDNDLEKIKEMVSDKFFGNEILKLEYFEIADATTLMPADKKTEDKKYRGFIAVFADTIRLIDNIALN